MSLNPPTWQEQLEIIDRTLKAISAISDPEERVKIYWDGIGDLVPAGDYVALSRRHVDPPHYLITRSSRFTRHFNPWTQRERLPRLVGGILGEIAYANRPVIIADLPSRLKPDDPGAHYLTGFQELIALPQYDGGEGLNVSVTLLPAGRELDRARIPNMHWHAGLFGRGTTNVVLRNQLGAALGALDRELQTVGAIQRSLLPRQLPAIPGFELATHYMTSARAGGDYYDFFPLPDDRWGLFIADVSGHGTPAAVLMAVTHALAHARPGTHTPPAGLLDYLNDHLARGYTHNGTFVTAFYAILDPASRTLMYSSSGHNPPRLVHDGRISELDGAGGLPLGLVAGQQHGQAVATMQRGDTLLLYTDAITDVMAPWRAEQPLDFFGLDRLDRVLLDSSGRPAAECVSRVCAALTAFGGDGPPTDDQTLVAVRCL